MPALLVSYWTLGHLFSAPSRGLGYWPAGHQARAHVCLARIWAKARSLVIKRCHTQIGNSRNCLKSSGADARDASGVYAAHRRLGAGLSA